MPQHVILSLLLLSLSDLLIISFPLCAANQHHFLLQINSTIERRFFFLLFFYSLLLGPQQRPPVAPNDKASATEAASYMDHCLTSPLSSIGASSTHTQYLLISQLKKDMVASVLTDKWPVSPYSCFFSGHRGDNILVRTEMKTMIMLASEGHEAHPIIP